MVGLIARLSRSIPLVIALIILAVVIYFVVKWRHSPARAKEVLIRVFLVITIALTAAFGLISLYALADSNWAVFELAISFAAVGAIGLAITLICRTVFLKNNPHYRKKASGKAKVKK